MFDFHIGATKHEKKTHLQVIHKVSTFSQYKAHSWTLLLLQNNGCPNICELSFLSLLFFENSLNQTTVNHKGFGLALDAFLPVLPPPFIHTLSLLLLSLIPLSSLHPFLSCFSAYSSRLILSSLLSLSFLILSPLTLPLSSFQSRLRSVK